MKAKPVPKALVAKLFERHYPQSDIARLLGVSCERVRQIRGRLGLTPPRARTVTDLPDDLRIEVERYLRSSCT